MTRPLGLEGPDPSDHVVGHCRFCEGGAPDGGIDIVESAFDGEEEYGDF